MRRQRLGSRVASAAISSLGGGSSKTCRIGVWYAVRPLISSAVAPQSHNTSPAQRHFQWLGQPLIRNDAILQGSGLGISEKSSPWSAHFNQLGISPWFNNLIQLRHHSSASSRGRGGRGHQDYTQVGGPIDATVCHLTEAEIYNLLSTRNQCRRKRDFQRADSIQEQLERCGVEVDDKAKTWRADGKLFEHARGGPKMPRMSDCRTMEEAIIAIHNNLEKASPRDMSAFWTVVPKLLNSRQGRKLQQSLVPQLSAIFSKTADRLGNYGQRDLVTTALAFAKIINILAEGRGRHVGGSYEEFLHDILVGRKEVIFKFIGKSTIPILSQIEPRSLSNLAFACALAGHVPTLENGSTLFQHLAERSIPMVGKFNPQDVSNMIWAFAKSEVSHPLMFEKVANHIVELDNLGEFIPQNLANTVWAFATAGVSHLPLFEKVADHIVGLDHLDEFKPQDFANIVGAFVKAGESHPPLFETVANCIVRLDHLGSFNPQNLANIVWAYAKADSSHPLLFQKVAHHIVKLASLAAFTPQNLANIVWAFATADMTHPPLFERIADHIVGLDNLEKFAPQALANIVWSFVKTGVSHPGLFDKIAHHIVSLDNLLAFKSPQALSNTVWAFATDGVPHLPLFEKVADHIASLDNLEEFKPQNLSNIVWAFAEAELSHPGLFDKIAHHIVSLDNLEDFNQQAISNLIWGFAKADVKNVELFDKLADVALNKEDEFTARDIANILRWTK